MSMPKEWWETVTHKDVIACRGPVNAFINDAEAADINQLEKALQLFILFGGNCTLLVGSIERVTERVCRGADRDSARIHSWREWLAQLHVICENLLLCVPDSYCKDVTKVQDCVKTGIPDCRQASMRIKKPGNKGIRIKK